MMRRMKSRRGLRIPLLLSFVVTAAVGGWLAPPRTGAQAPPVKHRMTKITETVYRADAPGTPGMNSTSWVSIDEKDVLVT